MARRTPQRGYGGEAGDTERKERRHGKSELSPRLKGALKGAAGAAAEEAAYSIALGPFGPVRYAKKLVSAIRQAARSKAASKIKEASPMAQKALRREGKKTRRKAMKAPRVGPGGGAVPGTPRFKSQIWSDLKHNVHGDFGRPKPPARATTAPPSFEVPPAKALPVPLKGTYQLKKAIPVKPKPKPKGARRSSDTPTEPGTKASGGKEWHDSDLSPSDLTEAVRKEMKGSKLPGPDTDPAAFIDRVKGKPPKRPSGLPTPSKPPQPPRKVTTIPAQATFREKQDVYRQMIDKMAGRHVSTREYKLLSTWQRRKTKGARPGLMPKWYTDFLKAGHKLPKGFKF